MRSCKKTSALLCKASRSQLSIGEWLGLKSHLLLCQLCRTQKHHYQLISEATKIILSDRHLISHLSSMARNRIQAALKAESTKSAHRNN